jgi:hypothetical protein
MKKNNYKIFHPKFIPPIIKNNNLSKQKESTKKLPLKQQYEKIHENFSNGKVKKIYKKIKKN